MNTDSLLHFAGRDGLLRLAAAARLVRLRRRREHDLHSLGRRAKAGEAIWRRLPTLQAERAEMDSRAESLGGLAQPDRIEIGGNHAMNEFEKKIRAAAVAGWWTVLIAVLFITLQWIVYLVVMSARPAWLLSMWGPGTDWPFVQQVWFWAIVFLKFVLWLMILIVIWLTLWARQLRKRASK